MAGVSTAYHLLHGNTNLPRIVILEARQLCSGATGRNGGHCKIRVPMLPSTISQYGGEAVEKFAEYVPGIIDGMKTIVEEEDLDCQFELRRSFDWAKDVSYIDETHAENVTSVKGATSAFSVAACSLWPYKFVTQLLARLLSRQPDHLIVQTNTPVLSVSSNNDDNNNLVVTSRGTTQCQKLIFATNTYTADLLPQSKDIIVPIHPPHLSNTYNIDYGPNKGVDYFNPRPNGSIVVGGGKWLYRDNPSSWFNNFDDFIFFSPSIQQYWDGYVLRNFYGWENSGAEVDKVWRGLMGVVTIILTAAKAVVKMVRTECHFGYMERELWVPMMLGTSESRLKRK
ncbi:hypothetical protein K469DRAFT_725694 [Zopfia rhizophila CBS 207.26]|uniref:FAD dependent oxidoreductase domain-containing protein n=1 Tax=Zopfia rhizophila CBS 207.26 TaxID=1314779 RepID=A0A6A6E8I8_9PEZI|nr:hypothetical protein K469DRAFT_725694 [Zopfia rhizophila CBS 207.26]